MLLSLHEGVVGMLWLDRYSIEALGTDSVDCCILRCLVTHSACASTTSGVWYGSAWEQWLSFLWLNKSC